MTDRATASQPVPSVPDPTPATPQKVPAPSDPPLPNASVSFVELAKKFSPAVVHIDVQVGRRNPFMFGGWETYGIGQGTGFIISPDGYILTNDHVVGKASAIRVRLADDREFAGKVIGADPKTDIALIKIEDTSPLPTAPLGDSDTVEIGEWVVAIGNPFGLDHTVTAGIVSAKGRRDIHPGGNRSGYYDFIQTDASINPGNSGGPLINVRGEVIGINSAVSAQGQGIGFAIPVNMAKTLIPLLKQHGHAPRSWIGVGIAPVTREIADKLGLSSTKGAVIAQVVPGSPAAEAGLKTGDIIVAFDGKTIHRHDDLPWLASTAGIGRTVPVVVAEKGGGQRELKVTLSEKPDHE
ncbi:MAG: trypsin-like peptidase domain-containing protein [Deltaproteobacteria bacterium]|nr:trypsin-like peptidase domain-containing protein [Deltaproteobacteria bacterium]